MEKEKIESAISDLIDTVERFFDVAPTRFLHFDGAGDDLADFMFLNRYEPRFQRFEAWFGHLMETLEPSAGEVQQKVEQAEKILDPLFRGSDLWSSWAAMCDSVGELSFAAERVGFYVGFFVGMKQQGATRSDLEKIGAALLLPVLAQWKAAAEYTERQEREQEKAQGPSLTLVKNELTH